MCEEEEESENETPRDEESGDGTTVAQNENDTQSEQVEAEQMIEQLRDGIWPCDDGTETMSDAKLNKLSYLDFKGLHKAHAKLTVLSKDKKLDVVFCARITALVGTINLYMDSELSYTWCEASLIVAKSQGQGSNHAQNLHTWIHCFLHHGKLPLHHYGCFSCSILNDKDFSQEI